MFLDPKNGTFFETLCSMKAFCLFHIAAFLTIRVVPGLFLLSCKMHFSHLQPAKYPPSGLATLALDIIITTAIVTKYATKIVRKLAIRFASLARCFHFISSSNCSLASFLLFLISQYSLDPGSPNGLPCW